MLNVIGKIGRHHSRPDRLALMTPTGDPIVWLLETQSLEELYAAFKNDGYHVTTDGTIVSSSVERKRR